MINVCLVIDECIKCCVSLLFMLLYECMNMEVGGNLNVVLEG